MNMNLLMDRLINLMLVWYHHGHLQFHRDHVSANGSKCNCILAEPIVTRVANVPKLTLTRIGMLSHLRHARDRMLRGKPE
jgi:hypothetical protein